MENEEFSNNNLINFSRDNNFQLLIPKIHKFDLSQFTIQQNDKGSIILGSGAYAKVILAKNRQDNKNYAIKIIDMYDVNGSDRQI